MLTFPSSRDRNIKKKDVQTEAHTGLFHEENDRAVCCLFHSKIVNPFALSRGIQFGKTVSKAQKIKKTIEIATLILVSKHAHWLVL